MDHIRFGLATFPQAPQAYSLVDEFEGVRREIVAAKQSGFDGVFAAHHYLSSPYRMLQTVPFLSRISADTGQMQIGTGILLVSLLNPVDVAEQIATLDVMTNGRVVFGVGIGYREEEFDAFGINKKLAIKRFTGTLNVITRLWTEDSVDFESDYCRLRGARLTTRPVQKPHPPIWIAANSDSAVRRAGRLGYSWFANPHVSTTTLERQMAIYREGLGNKPMPQDRPVAKELFIGRTREEALSEARPHIEGKYKVYTSWGQDKVLPSGERFADHWEELMEDRFIIGNPDDCKEQIERMHKRLGLNYFILRMRWPGMDHALSVNAIKLLGAEVIDYFKN